MALRSVTTIATRGMVVVMGGTDGRAVEVLREAGLTGISTMFEVGGLDDDGVVALGMKVARTKGVSLGPDVLGSWRRTSALALASERKRGSVCRLVMSAARRAKSRGSDVVGYDDLRLTTNLSAVPRPRPAITEMGENAFEID